MKTYICLLVLVFTSLAQADFGWRPKKEGLFLSAGFDYLSSEENFDGDSLLIPLTQNGPLNGGPATEYREFKMWFEPEYSLSEQWSARARFNFVSNTVSTLATDVFTGSNLGDILLGLKLALAKGKFSAVGELTLNIPTYSQINAIATDLLPGDSTFDTGLTAHLSYTNKNFFTVFSPGFVVRSSGFSPLLKSRLAGGLRFKPAYFYGFMDLQLALGDSLGYDTSAAEHNVNGSGWSYAVLSGSPSLFQLGAKAGLRLTQNLFLEAQGAKAMWGKFAPNFFRFGVNLLYVVDFEKPDTRPKVREVPFDSPHEEPEEPAPYTPEASAAPPAP